VLFAPLGEGRKRCRLHAGFCKSPRKNDKYKDAQKLGAEAVVGVSFSTSVMSQGAAELMAFGTAALIEDN